MGTITSANSTLTLSIAGLAIVSKPIQGYMADAAFETDAVESVELVRGVDGGLSAGYIFNNSPMTISLMPDSPSNALFDQWGSGNKAARETYPASGLVTLTSIGTKYTLTNGYLMRYTPIPSARRVLQGRPFVIVWQDISGAPM